MSATKKTAIERLVSMNESGRPQSQKIIDAITELQDVREWAEALTLLQEALESLESSTEQWADEEERDVKASWREDVEIGLDEVVSAYEAVTALPPISSALGEEVTF